MTASANETKKVFAPRPSLNFWKNRKDGKGSMLGVEYSADASAIFLTGMPQREGQENSFDSDKKVTAKLGLPDIGELLAVLTGKTEGTGKKNDKGFWTGLFHENSSGNSVISLSWSSNEAYPGYNFSLSTDREGNKQRLAIGLTVGEGVQLELFLRRFGSELFWPPVKN